MTTTTTHSNIKCIANSLIDAKGQIFSETYVANRQFTHSQVTYYLPTICFVQMFIFIFVFFPRYFVFKRIKIKLST